MSLSARITSSVTKAFNSVGDLVKTASLSNKDVSSFDFATGETVSTDSSVTLKVILDSTQKPSREGFTTTAFMKTSELAKASTPIDLSGYDTITIDSKAYNIIDFTDDGFVTRAIIVKEK